ncbi:MAG: hypothetical protein MUP85_20500 [Candidatus Lokiarchaeota archaeon]|nr:hypothetical protein [Candidatus Lokiarchaeota archaeon]
MIYILEIFSNFMVLINNAILRDKYQVIIIGAGLGGLTTAALLSLIC